MNKIFYILAFVFAISFISATGCCFDSSLGTCSPNANQDSCSSSTAQFFSDPTCASVSQCSYGCCTIGTSVSYTRESSCALLAQSGGSEYDWFEANSSQCSQISQNTKQGACVIQQSYQKTCQYTTQDNCRSGTFYENTLCSNPSLNTGCQKTTSTTCFGESVHYLDSCGNPDEKKQDCNYGQGYGSICQKIDSKTATCQSLNCKNQNTGQTIFNGQRWCVDSSGEGNAFFNPLLAEESATGKAIFNIKTTPATKKGLNGIITSDGLFLRNEENLSKNFLTGFDITTSHTNEECAAINAEKNQDSQNGNKPSYTCSNPGSTTNSEENVVYDPYTCEVCDQSLDACGENLCQRCVNDFGGHSSPGRLNGCVSDNACGGGAADAVGSRYVSQYCLNGQIMNEPCDDFRFGYCNDETTGGKCDINPWDTCIASGNTSDTCDENFCTFLNPAGNSESESQSSLMGDLNLQMCVPKIPGGLQFYQTQQAAGQGEQTDICSTANYQTTIHFISSGSQAGNWAIRFDKADSGANNYGNSGATTICIGDLGSYDSGDNQRKILPEVPLNSIIPPEPSTFSEAVIKGMAINEGKLPISKELVGALTGRCKAIADCDGKANWIGTKGSSASLGNIQEGEEGYYIPCTHKYDGSNTNVECSLSFECKQWTAPSGADSCQACGADGLPCSEYRCKSLGKGCEYSEPAGADKGFCTSSSDNSPPTISASLNPPSPIPPFSSVTISLSTNEISYCKFDLGNQSSSFDETQFETDGNWSTQHSFILNVPGKNPNPDVTSYDLITQDGNYNVYVRCEDPAGNSNSVPKLINFQVMQTPDQIPPAILNITPSSGSFVKFNTTQQSITLKINEPAECKWSQNDTDFDSMENSLNCDTSVSDYGLINGYFCNGVLTNINLNLSQQTKYYFRCKDQPWLQGNENQYYQRNKNPTSTSYILQTSQALNISEISPKGELIVGPSFNNLTIQVKTVNGAQNGQAKCQWRMTYGNYTTAYYQMSNTNSQTSTQLVSNISAGNYKFDIKCQDIAGNEDSKSANLVVLKDISAPFITRAYNNKGTLTLFTDEPSVCKYLNVLKEINCATFSFNNANATLLYGSNNLQHTTTWKKGLDYFIKCQDLYQNENSACDLILHSTI